MVSNNNSQQAEPVRRDMLKMIGGGAALTVGSTAVVGSSSADEGTTEMNANGARSASFRVLNWNIAHGEGLDGLYDLRRIAHLIERVDPDFVTLQEVDRELATRSECDDQPNLLEELTNMHVDFAANLNDWDGSDCEEGARGEYGTAILTKRNRPILDTEHHFLPNSPEQRGLQGIETRVNSRRVKLYNTHLTHLNDDDRADQIGAILDILENDAGSHIVAGDFNDTPESEPMGSMYGRYNDTFLEANDVDIPTHIEEEFDDAYTFPAAHWNSDEPHSRIDYVFASSDLAVERATLWETMSSDHSPIFADVSLPE